MKLVLVDTSIWSEVLRRRKNINLQTHKTLRSLIEEGKASIIGPIRQEILSGIKDVGQFESLKDTLSSFDDITIDSQMYELAAKFNNTCRSKGVQGSHVDFLICAVASHHGFEIYTSDKDFKSYSKHISIKIFDSKNYLK